MLRTANEMNAETREEIENMLMQKIENEAKHKNYSVYFSEKDIPDWLKTKLVEYGYMLSIDEDLINVSWEQLTDVE